MKEMVKKNGALLIEKYSVFPILCFSSDFAQIVTSFATRYM